MVRSRFNDPIEPMDLAAMRKTKALPSIFLMRSARRRCLRRRQR
jgi:hypothetical protein